MKISRVLAFFAAGQLTHRLAHHARRRIRMRIADFTFDFRLRRQRRHGVDDDDVNRAGAGQRITDFQRLLAGVRLGAQQVVDIDAQLFA